MKKFDVRICTCGRIHFVLNSDIDAALNEDKELVLICGGCGRTLCIGADRFHDEVFGECFNMYTREARDYTITAESFATDVYQTKIYKVIHSTGKRPRMLNCEFANYFFAPSGRFECTWYPDFHEIEKAGITTEEIFDFINKWRKERTTVDMKYLLTILTKEEADCLSDRIVGGLDWTGTAFDKKFK